MATAAAPWKAMGRKTTPRMKPIPPSQRVSPSSSGPTQARQKSRPRLTTPMSRVAAERHTSRSAKRVHPKTIRAASVGRAPGRDRAMAVKNRAQKTPAQVAARHRRRASSPRPGFQGRSRQHRLTSRDKPQRGIAMKTAPSRRLEASLRMFFRGGWRLMARPRRAAAPRKSWTERVFSLFRSPQAFQATTPRKRKGWIRTKVGIQLTMGNLITAW